jgi:hypothetical protein
MTNNQTNPKHQWRMFQTRLLPVLTIGALRIVACLVLGACDLVLH